MVFDFASSSSSSSFYKKGFNALMILPMAGNVFIYNIFYNTWESIKRT
jgi:hypothetical protein